MKKTIYIASGAPCSGKTTFIDQRIDALGGIRISRDEIRFSMLKPGDYYFKNEAKVFKEFIDKIQKAINNPIGKKEIYIDATHLNKRSRQKVLNRLNLKNVKEIIILWFNIPLEELLARNEKRYGIEKIPVDAIERMKNSMDIPSNEEKDARLKYYWEIDSDGWITEHTL